MQILKEEVRQRIIEAALNDFATLGYEQSSLRQIAKKAGITVGNIYAYFKDKNALLDAVMEPILSDLNKLIKEIAAHNDNTQEYLHVVAKEVVKVYYAHALQIKIVMSMMKHEKYGIYRQKLASGIASAILGQVPHLSEERLAKIIATSVIAGIAMIFEEIPLLSKNDAQLLVYQYLYFMFHLVEVD